MYEWVQGRPLVLVRTADIKHWPSAKAFGLEPENTVQLSAFRNAPFVVFREVDLTAAIPLELGGLMLVTARYCDSDESVQQHLDLVPVSGWETYPERFVVEEEAFSLFDGSRRGAEVLDPSKKAELVRETGGVVAVALVPGQYEIESFGPWQPDERTELVITRFIRVGPLAT